MPIAADNKDELRAAIDKYQPKGQTPTAYALQKAAEDLGPDGQRSIILVSDGEATCHPDPCVTAKKLAKQGIDLHIDVVGLKVGDTARKQLECVADSGNGTYFDADDAKSLTSALKLAQMAAHSPFDPHGTQVTGTRTRHDAPTLTEGDYVDAMPTDDDVDQIYRLHHTIPGSTLWVGITTQMAHGNFSTLNAKVEAPNGTWCSDDVAVHQQLTSLLVTSSDRDEKGCSAKHDQFLKISGEPDEVKKGQQLQISVVEEPPAHGPHTGADAKPAAMPDWTPMKAPSTPKPIPTVPSLSAAPKVTPGTYGLELAPHSVALVKVHLDWGQRLQVIGRVPASVDMWGPDTSIDVDLLSPIGGTVKEYLAPKEPERYVFVGGDQGTREPATMHPVDYANRNAGQANMSGTARPGDYYVAVSRRGAADDDDQVALPVHLQIAVVGTPGTGAPTYEKSSASSTSAPSTSPATATPSHTSSPTTPPTATTVAAPASESSSGTNWPLIGGLAGGVVVLAGVGGAAAGALRRRG